MNKSRICHEQIFRVVGVWWMVVIIRLSQSSLAGDWAGAEPDNKGPYEVLFICRDSLCRVALIKSRFSS